MIRLPMIAALLAMLLGTGSAFADERTVERPSTVWPEIREVLYEDREILDGAGLITLDTPYRAEDAAIVPVGITIDPGLGHQVVRMVLVVDENPAPIAAEFEFGEGMGHVLELSTRLRVNAYSNVRVIAELEDGTLYHVARFVKASGGCSAPALKDADEALASLGKIRLRLFDAEADPRPEAQVMVRHPNNSGFQMDQVTMLTIPPHFVDELEVTMDGTLLFRMVGGISISEDPTVRFRYVPDGDGVITVKAIDTDGGEFIRDFPTGKSS